MTVDKPSQSSLTNYCSYFDQVAQTQRIGHLSDDRTSIQPLYHRSGTPLTTLYEVIEVGEDGIVPAGESLPTSSSKILAPINGRDILCVGKNYMDHAKEFNSSGYDSSDKVDLPSHPVIFTKRFTSIIADGDEIQSHPKFTETMDYEGELGVIIGKSGFRIAESEALNYVWGYTIINDVTARERQRDHKQFYIGKSADTFCPMGPIAVPASKVAKVLKVQTRVNGELRQDATTEDLIFSVPYLVMTLSEGQTLMPGDVLATGTPAGVGFGQKPPTYLKPGDVVSVSITGLGTLTNRVASLSTPNPITKIVQNKRATTPTNAVRSMGKVNLHSVNGKPLHYTRSGNESGSPAVFVHGLGGTADFWGPLIETSGMASTHSLHRFDLEGHGLSPTSPLSELTLESFAQDLKGIFDLAGISSGATLFAHSLGCLIAVRFVLSNPGFVSKLILFGPPPSPPPEAVIEAIYARAALARSKGMPPVADALVTASTSVKTQKSNPLATTAVRLSLLGQDPEGYAKACAAAVKVTSALDLSQLQVETYIVTGSEDTISPPPLCENYQQALPRSIGLAVLQDVGHWHVFEDPAGVAKAISQVL